MLADAQLVSFLSVIALDVVGGGHLSAIEPQDWVRRNATQLWQKEQLQAVNIAALRNSYVAADK